MAVRSKRLAAGTVSSAGQNTLYTAPVGATALVKSIAVKNGGAGNGVYAVGGVPNGTSTNCDFFARISTNPILAGQTDSLLGWFALSPGDKLFLYIVSGGPFNYWVSGAELS